MVLLLGLSLYPSDLGLSRKSSVEFKGNNIVATDFWLIYFLENHGATRLLNPNRFFLTESMVSSFTELDNLYA